MNAEPAIAFLVGVVFQTAAILFFAMGLGWIK